MGECIKPLSPFRKARRRVAACAIGLAWASFAWASFAATAQVAQVSSERLIVIGDDGRAYLVQQRLATDGPRVSVDLPGEVMPLSVDSGEATARHRGRYDAAVRERDDGAFALTTDALPAGLRMGTGNASGDDAEHGADDATAVTTLTTWAFPAGATVVSWRTRPDDAGGRWHLEDGMLAYARDDARPTVLEIVYRLAAMPAGAEEAPATDLDPDADAGRDADPMSDANDDIAARSGAHRPEAIDLDADGVPDERDICVGADAAYRTTATPTTTTTPTAATPAVTTNAGAPIPGCDAGERVILGDVRFRSGSSYLEFDARRDLDRVAAALARLPDSRWNIAAYTDDEGSARWNRTLSMRRADAVRRYLMLRGLGPNQVSASGHGEKAPIADNASDAGRERNRRIELHRLAP